MGDKGSSDDGLQLDSQRTPSSVSAMTGRSLQSGGDCPIAPLFRRHCLFEHLGCKH